MKNIVSSIGCFLLLLATCAAQTDRVRTTSGVVLGEVTDSSAISVTVTRGSTEKKVPVSEIISVQFGSEPAELRQVRLNFRNGSYQKALEKIQQLDASDLENPFLPKEIVFYKVASRAKLALLGEGSVADAGRSLNQYLKQNRDSFHYLAGTELLGDLFVAVKRYDHAVAQYKQIAQTAKQETWPAYLIRAGVLLAEVSQAKGEHDEAIQRFDAVIAIKDDSPDAGQQKLRAQLGRAVSLAATGKLDEGVKLVQQVISDSNPEARKLNAMAYNVLGKCYLEAGQAKDAAFAYMHVDELYSAQREAHAESLYYLGSLLEEIGRPQLAREARQRLKKLYASSDWANK